MQVNNLFRWNINGDLEERFAVNRPVTEFICQHPVKKYVADIRLTPPQAGDMVIVYAKYINQEEACIIESMRKQSLASWVVRAQRVYCGFYDWATKNDVSFIPFDLSNGITVVNCLQLAATSLFIPGNCSKSLFGDFGRLIDEYIDSVRVPVIGILSMPRTGSKCIADSIVLWGAPKLDVFHAHDISADRFDKIQNHSKTCD